MVLPTSPFLPLLMAICNASFSSLVSGTNFSSMPSSHLAIKAANCPSGDKTSFVSLPTELEACDEEGGTRRAPALRIMDRRAFCDTGGRVNWHKAVFQKDPDCERLVSHWFDLNRAEALKDLVSWVFFGGPDLIKLILKELDSNVLLKLEGTGQSSLRLWRGRPDSVEWIAGLCPSGFIRKKQAARRFLPWRAGLR